MIAQHLTSELSTLLQESRKKNPDLRAAAEKSLDDLKALPRTSETQIVADLRYRPAFVKPFLLACNTRNPKFAGNAVAALQRLIISNALSQDVLGDVLEALRECSTLALDIQLKVLQALPSLLQNYASNLTGPLLIAAFQLCFLLYGNKTAVISNTAAAALQQVVSSTFEKAAKGKDTVFGESPASEVSIGDGTVSIKGPILDAHRVLDDLCLLTEGQKPKYIQGAFLSQNFGLELIESIFVNHVDTITMRPEQVHVLRIRLMPLLIRILSEKAPFPSTVRAMRLVQLIIRNLLVPLASDCEVVLSLLNHMLDPEAAPSWKRAMCLEAYQTLHADPSLMRSIYAQYDDADEKRNIVRDHLGNLVRLASEKPVVIGLGLQSSIPYVVPDDSSEQAALQAGGLVGSIGAAVTTIDLNTPGISNRWSFIKTPCIEQLDKSEATALPATYIYSLALICLTTFEDGLARFLLPFTVPMEKKAKRRQTKISGETGVSFSEGSHPPEEELLKAQSPRSRKVPVNPLSLVDHPQYSQISTSAHMVDQCWPALLAASSTYLNATIDSENYHALIRSFQKFTQIAGLLGLSTPRDTFLTTLGKHALPSNTPSKSFKTTSTPILNGQEVYEAENMTDSSRDASPVPGTPTVKRRRSNEMASPVMNSRHLLCLRALLNLGIALGPVLQTSWTIIFETLEQADILMSAAGKSHLKQGPSQRESQLGTADNPEDIEDLGLEITAAKTAASRLFESTSELTEEAFIDHLECLCQLLRNDVQMSQPPDTPNVMASPVPGVRKHRMIRSVSGISVEKSTVSHESAFALEKMGEVIRSNVARLSQTETEHSGWDLIIEVLMDTLSSLDTPIEVRIAAASALDGMLVLVAVSDESSAHSDLENIRARSLSALLCEVNVLYQHFSQSLRSSQQCELEIHRLVLEALRAILEHCGDNLVQGWKDVFLIVISAFARTPSIEYDASSYNRRGTRPTSSALVRSSFGSLQLICSDFLSSVPRSSLPQLLDTLYCFSAQDHDLNISLTTATFFRTTSDHLLRENEHLTLEGIAPDDVLGQMSEEISGTSLADASTQFLWLILLLQLIKLTNDLRLEVRHSALHTLFRILDANSDRLSSSSLPTLFEAVLKPLLRNNQEHHDRSREIANDAGTSLPTNTWNETAVVILEGLSRLFSPWLDTFRPSGDLSSMLNDLLNQFEAYLERQVLTVSKAVFGATSKMLAEVEDSASVGSHPIGTTWKLWMNNNPASHSGTDQKNIDNNDALLAYLYCLGQLLRLSRQKLDLQRINSTLEQLRSIITLATAPAYSTDLDTMTSVQTAVLEGLKMIVVNVEGAEKILVETLNHLVTMAYEQDIHEPKTQKSYVALSKASMAVLEQFVTNHAREKGQPDLSLLTAALTALDKTLHLKYTWRLEGRDPSPWKKATMTAMAILQSSTPMISKPDAIDISFWEIIVSIFDGIVAANSSACVNQENLLDDEAFDIETFSKLRDFMIPSLGSKSIRDSIRNQFSESLFRNSLIHEPNPDDLARPGEGLLDGLARKHFGRVKKLPPSPRSKMSYLLLDELFDLVATHNGSSERTRLAQAAGSYFILRIGLTLKTYILDQPLRGRMPHPRSERNEMLYILKKLVELKSVPEAIPGVANLQSSHKKHLHRLYPLLLKALKAAWRDEALTDALREVLEVIGDDFET
ncbi:MAG: hypothetical protein Q9164_002522 [Protoblastenia rupestris]